MIIPQQVRQQERGDAEWRPDPEEEAAIRAAELAEAQQRNSAQPAAARPRRERGGLGLE
jgi:hypothetical protein